MERLNNLRLVVMEAPYRTWSNPLTESLFAKMCGLKLNGYGREFPVDVLAVDTTDFISDHLLVCEESKDGLRPLFGNKAVPLSKCDQFHLPFPGVSVPQDAGSPAHVEAVNRIIDNARKKNIDLRYAGSMTIDPREKGDKSWTKLLRELFSCMYVSFYESINAEVITGCTIRFKIDDYGRWLGHKALEHKGEVLAPIRVAHLNNEPVLWMYHQEFSKEAKANAQKWKGLWDDRIHIYAADFEKQNLAA